MAYSSDRDRTFKELEYTKTPWPLPPLNLFMVSGYRPGVFDLKWDSPAVLAGNSRFQIIGVNVYRSFDSEYGPFNRITDLTVCANYWRDQTDNELIVEEDVTNQFILYGQEESAAGSDTPRWVFKTQFFPIIRPGSQAVPTNIPDEVEVRINGTRVNVLRVDGTVGEVEIDPRVFVDVVRQNYDPSIVPGPGATVTCTYRRNRVLVRTDLGQRIFYRITTVAVATGCDLSQVQCEQLLETPLEYATATSTQEIEKLDYIWAESIRRNRFILEQGGERAKVFIRKHVGIPCKCIPDEYHGQPLNDCLICYGTGYVGGYEGPYDILIAPDDGEKRVSQKETGWTLEHSYEVWTGPTPMLSQRDFIVRINGDRYSIGAVRFPSNRGMVLQQHFSIGHFDEQDIRYKVPVGNPVQYSAVEFKPSGPELEADSSITDKQNIPDERELRGRSKVWENITW